MSRIITGKQYRDAIDILAQSVVDDLADQINTMDPDAAEADKRDLLQTCVFESHTAEQLIQGSVGESILAKVKVLAKQPG